MDETEQQFLESLGVALSGELKVSEGKRFLYPCILCCAWNPSDTIKVGDTKIFICSECGLEFSYKHIEEGFWEVSAKPEAIRQHLSIINGPDHD